MVTQVPQVTNWSVTPQNGQVNYFTLMNTWLFESTSVIASFNAAINKINEAGEDINNIGANAINAITFDNIAQLKLNSNMGRVEVLGYYTKGDGGGGTFYWDSTSTETDNGGTIIQATGITTGRWKRVFSGAVKVEWFGAKGDGITDDTVPIQNAINTIEFAKAGMVELQPNKIYNISSSITAFNKQIILHGNNSTINLTSNSNYVLDIESNTCIFKNIVLSKNNGITASGIRLKGTRFILDNVRTFNSKFTNVFYLDECKESFFSNIRVDNDVSGLTGKIFYLHGAVNNTLSDSMIGFCDNAVYSDTYLSSEGFTVSNLITAYCNKAFKMDKITSLNITNSVLDFCTTCAIELSNGVFATMNNTWCALIDGSTGSMFTFGAGFSNIKVYDNFLVGNGASITTTAINSNAFDCDFSHNTLYNLNFGTLNGISCIHSFNKQFTGTANTGTAKGLFFNDGTLTINSIDSTDTTYSIGRFKEFTQNMQGSGSNLVYSNLGDVPTFGEVYVNETATNNYLILSFFKRGQSYSPVVTKIASSGLVFAGSNTNGTISITGYTNLANCVFSTKYRANR